jgi:hypothetical protein
MHNAGGELRRIPLPRTPVNKGKKKGRGCSKPRPFLLPANFFASYGATRLAVTRGSNVAVTTSDGLVCTNVNLLPSGAMN